jgi:hypothetical protein
MATRKVKWTSKADNCKTFRGKPRDKKQSSVTRQLKKPRRTGEDKVLQTDAIGGGGTVDNSRDFWYIEASSKEIMASAEVRETVEGAIETKDSDDSEDDNLPIAQTRLKEKVTVVAEEEVCSEDDTLMLETGVAMKPKLGLLGIGIEVMRQLRQEDKFVQNTIFRRRHGRHGSRGVRVRIPSGHGKWRGRQRPVIARFCQRGISVSTSKKGPTL